MKRHEERASPDLRQALERWDPVRREGDPGAEEVAAVRRRVLAAAPAARVPWPARWRPVTVVAAAVVLVVVLIREGGDGGPGRSRAVPQAAGAPAGDRAASGVTADAGAGGAAGPAAAGSPAGLAGASERADAGPTGDIGGAAEADAVSHDHLPVAGTRASDREAATAASAPPAAPPGSAPDRLARTEPETAAGAPDRLARTEPGTAAGASAPLARTDADAAFAPPGAAAPAVGGASAAAAPPRTIHLVAPGGTRIVWLVAAGPDPSTDSSKEST